MLEKGSGALPTLMPDWDQIEAHNLAIPVQDKTKSGQPSIDSVKPRRGVRN